MKTGSALPRFLDAVPQPLNGEDTTDWCLPITQIMLNHVNDKNKDSPLGQNCPWAHFQITVLRFCTIFIFYSNKCVFLSLPTLLLKNHKEKTTYNFNIFATWPVNEMYKSSRHKCWATMVLRTRCKTNTWPVVGPTTRVVWFRFFFLVSKFRDWLLAPCLGAKHLSNTALWHILCCRISYRSGTFFLGFKLPKRKTARVSSSVCFFVALFVRKRALFLYPFSLVLPATICQGGTKFLPRSRLPSWTKKKTKPKSRVFPLAPDSGSVTGIPNNWIMLNIEVCGKF